MTIYSFNENKLVKVNATTFNVEGIQERRDLQAAIKHQIDVVAPDCLVISEEFSEWADSSRRIDLLAVDKTGNLVVIELKRTETGDHMELQALRYAAMVSTLTFSRAVEIYQKHLSAISSELNAKEHLIEFLGGDEFQENDFALDVRIILVSSDFSKELTTSVMWLNERDIAIKCVRLIPYKHQNQLLIDVQQIIPLPEVESYQIKIKQQTEERRETKKSLRDHTQYLFNGISYGKRQLVLASIHQFIKTKKPNSIDELIQSFQINGVGDRLFKKIIEPLTFYVQENPPRYFYGENEIINLPDGTTYAIYNQWSKVNIEHFIVQAAGAGLEIVVLQ